MVGGPDAGFHAEAVEDDPALFPDQLVEVGGHVAADIDQIAGVGFPGVPGGALGFDRRQLVVEGCPALGDAVELADEGSDGGVVGRLADGGGEAGFLAVDFSEFAGDDFGAAAGRVVTATSLDLALEEVVVVHDLMDGDPHGLVEDVGGDSVLPARTCHVGVRAADIFVPVVLVSRPGVHRAVAVATGGEASTEERFLGFAGVADGPLFVGGDVFLGGVPCLASDDRRNDAGREFDAGQEVRIDAAVIRPAARLAMVGGIEQDAPHGGRAPAVIAAGRSGDAFFGELAGDGAEGCAAGVFAVDPPDDAGLGIVDLEAAAVIIAPSVAVERFAIGEEFAALEAGLLAAGGALGDLLAFHLANEGLDGAYQPAGRGVIELLGDELEASAAVLQLINKDGSVGLVAAEAIEGVAEDDVNFAGADSLADLGETRAFAVLGAGPCVAVLADDGVAVLGGVVATGGELGAERGAVLFLAGRADAGVDRGASHGISFQCVYRGCGMASEYPSKSCQRTTF